MMGQYLSWGANSALFTLCCFLVADTSTGVIGALLAPGPQVVETDSAPAALPERTWRDREVILTRNLFNSTTLEPPPAEPEPEPEEDLEATKLPLTLLGTTAAADPALSWAAVADRQARDNLVVSVGDSLGGKATVLRIERRRIILSENGVPRELTLDDEDAPEVRRPARRSPRRASRSPVSPTRISRLGDDRFSVPRSDVERNLRNPANLFSQARILPKYEGGQMVGVQVNSIKEGSLFEQIGLEDGDVITELNGIAIDSPEQSARILQEFSEASEFDVVVDKNGSLSTLQFVLPDE
jgi:general secretion pathway protein C